MLASATKAVRGKECTSSGTGPRPGLYMTACVCVCVLLGLKPSDDCSRVLSICLETEAERLKQSKGAGGASERSKDPSER